MPLLIDAYNVLQTVGVLPPELAGVDLAGLARLIERSRWRRQKVELICDGFVRSDVPPRSRLLIVRFAGPGNEADDLIRMLVARSTHPRQLVVVSSDRAILQDVRKRRCRTLTSEQFLAQLAHDHDDTPRRVVSQGDGRPPVPLAEAEVKRWLRQFEVDRKLLKIQAAGAPEPTVPAPRENTMNAPAQRSEQPAAEHDEQSPSTSAPASNIEAATHPPVRANRNANAHSLSDDEMQRLFPDVKPRS